MATRTLTPGSYIVLAGLLLLSLIIAVVSFIIPFNLYGAGSHDKEKSHDDKTETVTVDTDNLMHAPEPSSSSAAAQEFQQKILMSFSESNASDASSEELDTEDTTTGEEESDSSAASDE